MKCRKYKPSAKKQKMNHSESIKHHSPLWLLLTLVLIASCSHKAEQLDESPLYQHYALRQELKVAQVGNFKLSDSVFTDVVMLQADDEATWQALTDEFDIRGTEGTVSWLGVPDNPVQRTQWDGKPVIRVIASHTKRTIGLYQIDNEAQYDALIDYQIEKMKKNN